MKREKEFDFWEIVRISSNKDSLKHLNGRRAFVDSFAEGEEEPYKHYYGVTILTDNGEVNEIELSWSVYESDLQFLAGEKFDKNKIYTGETVKVRVDPETGEGEIVEKYDD